MILGIKNFLWESAGFADELNAKDVNDIKVLVIASEWKKETGKSIFAIFPPERKFPKFILSMMHDAKFNYYLEREYQNLNFVRNNIKEHLKEQIPEPVYLGKILDHQCLIQAAIPGYSLRVHIHSRPGKWLMRKKIQMFQKLVDWLLLFESTCQTEKKSQSVGIKDLIIKELDTFRQSQVCDQFINDSIDRLKEQADSMSQSLPQPKPQHCDFWVGNVFIQDKEIRGVFDWEMFEKRSIPFNDLFSLVTHCGIWSGRPDSGNYLLNEFKMQFKSKWFSEQVACWFGTYLKRNHLVAEILDVLIPVILIKRTNGMQKIIQENSIPIKNTWKELVQFYLTNKDDYFPLKAVTRKNN